MPPDSRRVVITGFGLVSPLGDTPEDLWIALSSGKSGVGRLDSIPAGALPVNIAAEAKCFTGDADNFGPLDKELKKTIRKAQKVMCREIQMGIAAAQKALFHAELIPGPRYNPDRTGTLFGSDYMLSSPDEFSAGIAACHGENGENFVYGKWATDAFPQLYPLWLLKYLPNMPAAHVSIFNDLRGPNNSLTQREASANLALGEAFRTIARCHADVMVAGATGTRVQPMKAIHAVQTEELAQADQPERAARPFDRDRTGMVLGEGAGVVILEELSHALARGAKIYGELAGHASATVANRRGVADRALALTHVIRQTLADARISSAELGHIHAHGLGTRECDKAEARAILTGCGAEVGGRIPVVAAKSNFGNLGAGSGVVELIASLLALREGRLFPVLNYETPDPDCPLRVVRDSDTPAGSSVLNLNVTPQGQAAGILVRTYTG
ncbi:MAG: beta-ketoacyl-[acyl-carrier-protein] synthase family protein [Pirellulales bacterium]|nr:beta-ketoacyl-[acyl-carrier-protein] synthase family protein [Pirellulales bacterium]